ncbi:hypothetical protein NQ314_007698 [Rhamnusium bicolor]|uniref:Ankyrin repeat-containing protein n=1 Tax=Rhamnusium bicolor TaxID=1586634 RepID=A0AAV8YHE9_9CUCU|nr:hypothetical protein NQ314_007698 [Rhamnusium bicolor]
MDTSSDSDEELFPVVNNQYVSSDGNVFRYDDPLLVSGVLRAVVEEDLQKVKFMVDSGKSVNINDNNGNTPLHVAVIKNNLEIIDFLLAQDDIVVNIRNFRGETPLFQAVRNGRFESTQKLIRIGANVNLPNHEEVTPLHVSVTHTELAHLLILHGAHIDAIDYSGDTPLHDATAEGCLETVCMLLYYNADANAIGGNNLTPFMKALIAENIEIQHALFEYVDDFNIATVDHMTTLALALTHDTPYVYEIIQRGAEVNYADIYLYEEVACAFFLCLRVPNHQNFKLIWEKLHYNEIINSINLFALFEHLGLSDLEKYIDVIIESDNVKTAVESLSKNENYFFFINKFAETDLRLEQLTKLTCRLILYGYRVTSYDIYEIFLHYGYCELFKMLLYMENNYSYGWLPHMIVPRLIFDLDCKLSNVLIEMARIYRNEVGKLLEYFVYPPLMKVYLHKYRYDDDMMEIILKLPEVPLLIELARNKSREHIAKTFNTTSACQFYTTVNHLNISTVYKKILTFEKKLYKVKSSSTIS